MKWLPSKENRQNSESRKKKDESKSRLVIATGGSFANIFNSVEEISLL